MTLELHIPGERAAPPKDLEVRPRQVRAWVESLPLAQASEATRQLCAHMAAVNRARVPVDDRLSILEAYRPVAAVLLDEMDAIYARSPLPLTPRAREALTLARDLAAELATGYKIALVEKAGKLIAFGTKKQMPLLMLRALEYLSTGLQASYKAYTPVPPGLWRDMHRIYLHAEREGIARDPGDTESRATVTDVYGEALLLSLTDPYRLPQGEAAKVIAQLAGYRSLVALGQSRPATRPGGHFIVPCDTDKPPKPALSANDDTGGPNWRLLDANAVVDKIRARRDALESGNVSATTSRMTGPDGLALLARLVVLWGDPPKRAHRREPGNGSVAVCAGLKAVGHFVAQQPQLDAAAEAEALRKGITLPLLALPMDDASQSMPVFEWDIVNLSPGGLKLRRMGPTPQPIAVGEIVGLKFAGPMRWSLAVARWITLFDEGGMEFGVQFLGDAARSVWLQPAVNPSPQAKAALLLRAAGGALSLVAPPGTFAELREFEVDDGGATSRVRAKRLLEKTARFEHFEVAAS